MKLGGGKQFVFKVLEGLADLGAFLEAPHHESLQGAGFWQNPLGTGGWKIFAKTSVLFRGSKYFQKHLLSQCSYFINTL